MERPIKPSKNGKYNLNFIDWNNEWERVNEIERKIENDEPVSDEEEKQRVLNNLNKEKEKNGINKHYANQNLKILTKQEVDKVVKIKSECYICLLKFEVKARIRELPCKHIFHDSCLNPWLKYHHNCPTCKKNVKEVELIEEDEYVN